MLSNYENEVLRDILHKQSIYERQITKAYRAALVEMKDEMALIYKKYAINGILSQADMARYHRLSEMEKHILGILDPVMKDNIKKVKTIPADMYNESYLKHAWAIDQATGLRLDWGNINPDQALEAVSSKYMKISLDNYGPNARDVVKKYMVAGLVKGKSLDNMANSLQKAMNIVNYKALRIARTEGMRAMNAGTADSYIKAKSEGVEGYEVWDATLDGKTRPTHQIMDGAKRTAGAFDGWTLTTGEFIEGPGYNYAPYPGYEGLPPEESVNCRCHLRFEIEGFSPLLRRTREDGVIPYQTYDQWKKSPKIFEYKKTPEDIQREFGATLRKIKSLGGSTGAWLAADNNDEKWVVKQYLNAQNPSNSIANEYIASKLYTTVGVNVPESRIAIINDQPAFVTKMLEGGTTLGEYKNAISSSLIRQQVQDGFVADALFANWDSIGLSEDNILIKAGKAYRIDLGGSLLYRAQGSPKTSLFTSDSINELKTLRDPNVNKNAAKWFKKISDQEILNQIKKIQGSLTIDYMNQIIDSTGLDDHGKSLLKYKLSSRIAVLDEYAQKLSRTISNKIGVQQLAQEVKEKGLTGFAPPSKDSFIYKVKDRYSDYEGESVLTKAFEKMNHSEQAALKSFTGNGYYSYNANAISGDPDNNLKGAISKLPRVDNNLIRKISAKSDDHAKMLEDNFNKWISGEWEEVEWKGFSSSSLSESGWSGRYEFIIINDGTNLDAGYVGMLTSANKREREVLINSGSKFKVIGYSKGDYGKTLLIRPKAPWEPTGINQSPVKQYTHSEILDIFRNDIKIYE